MAWYSPLRSAKVRIAVLLGGSVVGALCAGSCMFRMPGKSYRGSLPELTRGETGARERLRGHIHELAEKIGERNVWRPWSLQSAADYVERSLRDAGYEPARQEFDAGGRKVANIEVELTGRDKPSQVLVIGAHYDTIPGCPGANDNGTGVAAMLEIARALRDLPLRRTVRFVAFVNEEPPFFQTSNEMGSRVYARRCAKRGEKVVGMISLETIGYYSDEPGSQQYPFPFSLAYPSTGNFIAFVGNMSSGRFVRRCVSAFRKNARFPSEGGALPGWITGIGWSDHWSFWQEGYPALMVTDTAPFRYAHYHYPSDTADKIDYDRFARVTVGLAQTIADLAGQGEPRKSAED